MPSANRSLAFLVPGRLATRTGGYEYDRRMIAGLHARGWSIDVRELDGGFPYPTRSALKDAACVLGSLPDGATVLIDGLAFGAMPDEVEREASRLRIVALIHLPLAAEAGIAADVAARLEAGERRALAAASLVVATGHGTQATLVRYGVRAKLIEVIEPGTEPAPLSRGSRSGPLQLLCVATINAGKGHEILFSALASLPHGQWRLSCAGSLDRDLPTVERLRAQLKKDRLLSRVSLAGELGTEELAACYSKADLFVLATRHETYGMAVAEALAHGLPVVSTSIDAIVRLVGNDAGRLVPVGDVPALTAALAEVIGNADLRARLAEGARRVRDRLPTWSDAVGQMAEALERVATRG